MVWLDQTDFMSAFTRCGMTSNNFIQDLMCVCVFYDLNDLNDIYSS